MLKEAMEFLLGQGAERDRARVVRIPGVHRRVWMDTNDGGPSEIDIDPPLRSDTVATVSDIVEVIESAGNPEVWVGNGSTVVLLDRKDRRERVTCLHPESDRFRTLRGLDSVTREFTPAEAIRFLRFELPGDHAAPLIDTLRTVDFTRKSDGRATTEHGRESLGRKVEAQVQGQSAIPETFSVSVNPWGFPGAFSIGAVVAVGIHIDVTKERIVFGVLPDEMANAVFDAREQLFEKIKSSIKANPEIAEVPIYIGHPENQPVVDAAGRLA